MNIFSSIWSSSHKVKNIHLIRSETISFLLPFSTTFTSDCCISYIKKKKKKWFILHNDVLPGKTNNLKCEVAFINYNLYHITINRYFLVNLTCLRVRIVLCISDKFGGSRARDKRACGSPMFSILVLRTI